MNTAPKLPAALEPVAWLDDGLSASNGTEDSSFRVVTDKTKRGMPHSAVVAYTTPLVRLSDAQAALQQAALRYVGLFGELQRSIEANEALLADAARYRWLREQEWYESDLCVLCDPKRVLTRGIGLGADCPSHDRLDAAIDAARALAPQEAKP